MSDQATMDATRGRACTGSTLCLLGRAIALLSCALLWCAVPALAEDVPLAGPADRGAADDPPGDDTPGDDAAGDDTPGDDAAGDDAAGDDAPDGEDAPADPKTSDGAEDAAEKGAGDEAEGDEEEEEDRRQFLRKIMEDGFVLAEPEKGPKVRLTLNMTLETFSVADGDYTGALRRGVRTQPGVPPPPDLLGGRLGKTDSGDVDPRINVGLIGEVHPRLPFTIGFEYTPDSYGVRDFFVDANFLPLLFCCSECAPELRLGNFVEPLGLEANTKAWERTFMSRAAASMTFGLGHSLGAMAHDGLWGGRFGYALGYFYSPESENDEFSNRQTDETVVRDGHGPTARVWWMPFVGSPGICRRLLIGASASARNDMSRIQFRSRPESFTFGYAIDTNFSRDAAGVPLLNDATSANFYAAEASWVRGPFYAQAEYFMADVDSTRGGDPRFTGGYVMAGVWLTGECRRLECGGLSPSEICCPVDPCSDRCCWGGLELAARYGTVDLNDANIAGGTMENWSLELNWWWGAGRRLMLNYVRSQIDDGTVDEAIGIFQFRIQLGF